MPGGMGTYFGEADLALWSGAKDIDPSLKLEPYCLLRIADSQVEARNSQYAGWAHLRLMKRQIRL